MTDVIVELYGALEELRKTLTNVTISDEVKGQIEDLVRPIFENEISRQRVTDIINEIGDFSENILVPLLEQYVSANVALRVKFLIEDLLVFVENYRDVLVRKIEREKRETTEKRRVQAGNTTYRAQTMKKLAVNSATNHYRDAIFGNTRTNNKYASFRSQPNRMRNGSLQPGKVNTFGGGLRTVSKQNHNKPGSKLHQLRQVTITKKQVTEMTSIVYNSTTKDIEASLANLKPSPTQSGEVLIKLTAVGLNAADLPSTGVKTEETIAEPPHVTQIKAISKSFMTLTGSRSQSMRQSLKPNTSNIIGQEFCGIVEDIAWKRGDFVHRMHVAKGNFVYGVTSSGRGALGEYVVCNINDVVRCPGPISSVPQDAARVGVDGGVVCRALAGADITNTRGTRVLVVGGATNKGMILIELLMKDINIPLRNITALTSENHVDVLTRGGLTVNNVKEFKDANELADNTFDLIFDCYAEVDIENRNFDKLLEKKKRRSCQYIKVDTTKVLNDKRARNEDWQKEFQLLNRIIKMRKLTLDMFINDVTIEYNATSIEEAYDGIISGDMLGKAVVEINAETVEGFKDRLN